MDILLSALASDIASRIVSFLLAKYQKDTTTDKMIKLHQLLLRTRTIVDEADGRHITNQGMLLQLRQLRKAMYEGQRVLDTFKGHPEVSQSFNLNKIQVTVESLESTIGDMKEFLMFLVGCPRMFRQPYSVYLFMERCMFGRHMEKDCIINFLMQPSKISLEVLPVTGPVEVGKRTLVEHVLKEEMVQKQFPCVVRLSSDDLNNLANDSVIKQHNLINFTKRCLIVVELEHYTDLLTWRRFQSWLSKTNTTIKVILITGLRKVSDQLGTTQSLKLKWTHPDELWYFFRTLSFGSENPDEHHALLSIAMKIAALIKGYLGANIVSRLLRANFNAQFWRQILNIMTEGGRLNLHAFGEHPDDRVGKRCCYILLNISDETIIVSNSKYSTTRGVPRITLEDIINRTAAVPSKVNFEVLLWQSSIAPYYSYVGNCVIKKTSQVVPRERSLKRKKKGMKS